MLKSSSRLHIPEPGCRPGETPDMSHIKVPPAGEVRRPAEDVDPAEIRDLAWALIRVLDDDGNPVGDWNPGLSADVLEKGLRAMMLTRAYDARMVRVQRQGKTSFYMKSTGEEAVAVAAALALEYGDMCFPT